jgi:hypothetical protein
MIKFVELINCNLETVYSQFERLFIIYKLLKSMENIMKRFEIKDETIVSLQVCCKFVTEIINYDARKKDNSYKKIILFLRITLYNNALQLFKQLMNIEE